MKSLIIGIMVAVSALSVSKYRVIRVEQDQEARPMRAYPASRRDRFRVKSSAA